MQKHIFTNLGYYLMKVKNYTEDDADMALLMWHMDIKIPEGVRKDIKDWENQLICRSHE